MSAGGSNKTSSISSSEQRYILEGCLANCREDGRSRDEFRPYYGVVNDFALSYGSARVFLPTQKTHLLVSVKAELVVPASAAPNEGVVEVRVDFMHNDKSGNRKDETLEWTLANLLVPHLVDTKKLCIAPEYYVWKMSIDIFVIGNETDVPWGRGYLWSEDMKIDESKLKPETFLCYSPLRALDYGFCDATFSTGGLSPNVSF